MRWTQFPLSNLKHLLHLHSRLYIIFFLFAFNNLRRGLFVCLETGFWKGKGIRNIKKHIFAFFSYSDQMRFDHVYLEVYEPKVENNFFFLSYWEFGPKQIPFRIPVILWDVYQTRSKYPHHFWLALWTLQHWKHKETELVTWQLVFTS